MLYKDYISVLYVDLNAEKIRIVRRTDLVDYLGGVGVAARLLEENIKPGAPPLDPSQPVIFANGALSSIFPVITKTVAMFVSPLTGELGESYAGGRLAMSMFNAGYDAIVITGISRRPTYLSISSNDIEFRDARALWGTDIGQTGSMIRGREGGHGKRSIIRIGEAGENQVAFASACVDTYRHFGRLGLGAVLGSKRLKAVTVIGDGNLPIANFPKYFKTWRKIYDRCTQTDMMSKYHDAGTPINILPLNASGGLPTRNLQATTFAHADELSGENFAKKHLIRKNACSGCPVGCIHIAQLRREFAEHGHEYEVVKVGYDYELIYALGTFLGMERTEDVLDLIDRVELFGLDAMSAGVALGWATEALEKGIVPLEDTIVPLAFGDVECYKQALEHLSKRSNFFYYNLGEGVAKAGKIYEGEDFAMQIGGNEMAGYHTGYGSLVGQAVGARHSHLCNGGYAIDQGKDAKDLSPEDLVNKIYKEEVERCVVNSLIMCLFARKVYDRDMILEAFQAVGRDMTNEKLDEIGKRIYRTKLRIKQLLGFRTQDIRFPKRYFETESANGQLDESKAYQMLELYAQTCNKLMQEEMQP